LVHAARVVAHGEAEQRARGVVGDVDLDARRAGVGGVLDQLADAEQRLGELLGEGLEEALNVDGGAVALDLGGIRARAVRATAGPGHFGESTTSAPCPAEPGGLLPRAMAKDAKEGTSEAGRITKRAEGYSDWYQDVVREGQLAEVAHVVKG